MGAGAFSARGGAGVDGDTAMTIDGVEVFHEAARAGVLTLPKAAYGSRACGGGKAVAALESQWRA